jgi:hypothetical protein
MDGSNLSEGNDTINIDLNELQGNREEINNRTGISTKLVLGQTTILGLSISLLSTLDKLGDKALGVYLPDILLGVSIFCSFLFHFWLEQTQQIYKLGAYNGKELAGRLRQQSGNNKVLGWEAFSKIFDKGGASANRMLFGEHQLTNQDSVPPTRNIIGIVGILMGGVPALFAFVAFLFIGLKWADASSWLRITEICVGVVAVALWVYAMLEYRLVCHKRKLLDKAVIENVVSHNNPSGTGTKNPPTMTA